MVAHHRQTQTRAWYGSKVICITDEKGPINERVVKPLHLSPETLSQPDVTISICLHWRQNVIIII